MDVTRIGIDLAKHVFQIHGVDCHGKVVVRKQLRRPQMLAYFAKLPPQLIGMEACGGGHYWARELSKLGHDTRLMAPQFVKPYVKSGKNDANDAEAICEAVSRPNMRFVAVKSVEQQVMQAEHRIRARLIKARTALSNEIRGLLAELGIVVPASLGQLRRAIFVKSVVPVSAAEMEAVNATNVVALPPCGHAGQGVAGVGVAKTAEYLGRVDFL